MPVFDLATTPLREFHRALHAAPAGSNEAFEVLNPRGAHSVAVGAMAPVRVDVHGSVGPGVAENMMSGRVTVKGAASQYAGATGRGGLLVIEGDASSRCGISMKGIEIVVKGSIGHMSAFMAQKGVLAVLGDAGEALGDSLYEARLYVRGSVKSLGADCVEKEMRAEHIAQLSDLLARAGVEADPASFRRYGSARKLYHFNVDHAGDY